MQVNHVFNGRAPKQDESINGCQDHYGINQAKRCFAIADGASQSFYPSIWAKLLVERFCENPEINFDNWRVWLEPIQEQWLSEVKNRVEKAKSEKRPSWIESQNGLAAKKSATSTFLGLQFLTDSLKISVVGDSCLFIFINGKLYESYLLGKSKDFDDRPKYFASYSKSNDFPPQFFDIPFDIYKENEVHFFLATDALSEYIFQCLEEKKDIFTDLLQIESQELFEKFITFARCDKIKMKNDDVTLVTLLLSTQSLSTPEISIDSNTISVLDNITQSISPSISINHKDSQINLDTTSKPLNLKSYTKKQMALLGLISGEKESSKMNKSIQQLHKENNFLKRLNVSLILLIVILLSILYFIKRDETKLNPDLATQPQPTTSPTPNLNKANEPKTENPQITGSNVKIPTTTIIKKGTTIYKDALLQEVIIESTNITFLKASIVEESSDFIKFTLPLYAHKSTSETRNCQGSNINLIENLRTSASSGDDNNLFGTLKQSTIFRNLSPKAIVWCKVELEGYIKK